MNARLLERLVTYRERHGLDVCKFILSKKIKNQFNVVHKKELAKVYNAEIATSGTVQSLMLLEARAARRYWKLWGGLLAGKIEWLGRHPRSKDPANQLLDIGYHYLAGQIVKICREIGLPTELGIFHKAQSKNANPLVYDLMEWMRPCVVDRTLMGFLRKKKKLVSEINEKLIGRFVSKLKDAFEKSYYHRKLKYCITLKYWIQLTLLEFMGAVNNNTLYNPLIPSLRHESRCKKNRPGEPERR